MTFERALKMAERGNMVIGKLDGDDRKIMVHYHGGKYYTEYGMELNLKNPNLEKMHWDIMYTEDEICKPCVDFLHHFLYIDSVKDAAQFMMCSKDNVNLVYSQECFDETVMKQIYIAKTTDDSYMINIIRLLTTVEKAVSSGIYDHIYVFVKDELLYKDVARKKQFCEKVFGVSDQSDITFIFVREGANCLGFLANVFDIKEGSRILRIYDQRVTEGLKEEDIKNHYYMAQQNRDDSIFFLAPDTKKDEIMEECGNYWIDISNKFILPPSYYKNTILNMMDEIMNSITHGGKEKYTSYVNYSSLSEI